MKILKSEKGSITLFVLLAMLFFVMYLVGMYMLSANSESSVIEESARIKEIYEQGVNNIDDVYNTELQKSYEQLSKIAKLGDYIKYNTGVESIGEKGIVTFRVLYNDSINGLQVISNKNIEQVMLGGDNWETASTSYNNAILTLNNNAKKYINRMYATDARCVGTNPVNKNDESIGYVTLMFNTTIESANQMKIDDEKYLPDIEAMKNANILITNEDYWIAARYINSNIEYCNFGVHFINKNGEKDINNLCIIDANNSTTGESKEYGLRICITLKESVKVIKGDGKTQTTAYEIDI